MPVSVKVGGAWKTASAVFNKVGGVWKTASDMPVKVGGVWKTGILVPKIGTWSASTSYPYVFNIYMDARSVGTSAFATLGGGDLNSQTRHSYRWNGSSWTSLSGNTATMFPNIAGSKYADAMQTLGGYYVQGENGYELYQPYSLTSSATSWTYLGGTVPVATNVGGAIAWPSNVWSVTSGQSGNNTYYRTGTGGWSQGTNFPAAYVGTRGHHAYSRGYAVYDSGQAYYSTSAGGAYTAASSFTVANSAHNKLSVVKDSLFYSDTSIGTNVYRYNSDGTSTLMTSPSGDWTYAALASAGDNISMFGGRLNGTNSTGQHYVATVS